MTKYRRNARDILSDLFFSTGELQSRKKSLSVGGWHGGFLWSRFPQYGGQGERGAKPS